MPYQWYGKMTPFNARCDELPLIDSSVIKEIQAFCKNADNPIARLNDMTWKGVGGGGDTHETCVAAVARMVHDEWTDDQIHARIRRAKRAACERAGETYHWPAEPTACQEWIDSAREKEFGRQKARSKPSHGDFANLVFSKHGAVIRRDKARRDWCVYNGKFWEEGATEEVKTLIRQCLTDDQVFKSTIDGVEGVMRLYPEVGIRNDIWDSDKHYLNCPDGTYNLKTREKLAHNPAHLITKITRVGPRFDYQDSLWVKSVSTWFGGDAVEIDYIQTLFGMFLTGETKDECVAMWIGKSGAGKTKMTEIMDYIMGDYAQTATDTAFLEVRYHPHQEEVARMRGKRLVFIHEVEGYLNLRRVKSIASGEATSASFKGKDTFQFNPEAKIWFVGNEAPPTKSSGRELQRRFHVYEFVRQIDEKNMDFDLREKLRAEADQILGWVIDGAIKYYKNGLTRSPHVIESTNRYFSDADILEQWVEEHCAVDRLASTPVVTLFENFDAWADSSGIKGKPCGLVSTAREGQPAMTPLTPSSMSCPPVAEARIAINPHQPYNTHLLLVSGCQGIFRGGVWTRRALTLAIAGYLDLMTTSGPSAVMKCQHASDGWTGEYSPTTHRMGVRHDLAHRHAASERERQAERLPMPGDLMLGPSRSLTAGVGTKRSFQRVTVNVGFRTNRPFAGRGSRHSRKKSRPVSNCPVLRGRAEIAVVVPLTNNHACKVVAHFSNPTGLSDTHANVEILLCRSLSIIMNLRVVLHRQKCV